MALKIPAELAVHCRKSAERMAWLDRLPNLLQELERKWFLRLEDLFEDGEASYVVAAVRADGTHAVLKIGMPHMEAEQEIEGLRFWNGDPTVRLLEVDESLGAMLLERCQPGTALKALDESEQDTVISALLRRLWRKPPASHLFRPLSALMSHWRDETLAGAALWPDAAMVREGLRLMEELSLTVPTDVLLATDLHAGNVLRAEREPWLVIDPKPFIGDPAYDATQHLFNGRGRMQSDPYGTIRRFADLLGLDAERVRLWTFARAAAQPRDSWQNSTLFSIARSIAP